MTCQLTYQSWMVKDVKTFKGVQSVEISQEERRLVWLFGVVEEQPYKLVASLNTADGSHVFKVYNHYRSKSYNHADNDVASDEISQFRKRLHVFESSPSEGLFMSFSRRRWRDFRYLIFEIAGHFLSLPIASVPIALLLTVSQKNNRNVSLVCSLKQLVISSPNRYFLLGSLSTLLAVVVFSDASSVLFVSVGMLVFIIVFSFWLAAFMLCNFSAAAEVRNLLAPGVFSNRLDAVLTLDKDLCLEETELSDWQKQRKQSLDIHKLAAELSQQWSVFGASLSDVLQTVLQLNSQFSTSFETARLMKVLSYSTVGLPAENRRHFSYQKVSQQRFLKSIQRLVQIRQRTSQTQQHLQLLHNQLFVKDLEREDVSALLDVATQIQLLIEANKVEIARH
ncbi:MAG: hypothetical protein AAF810_25765 [Cyanobacteria bacterium P01_D01_bin.36]